MRPQCDRLQLSLEKDKNKSTIYHVPGQVAFFRFALCDAGWFRPTADGYNWRGYSTICRENTTIWGLRGRLFQYVWAGAEGFIRGFLSGVLSLLSDSQDRKSAESKESRFTTNDVCCLGGTASWSCALGSMGNLRLRTLTTQQGCSLYCAAPLWRKGRLLLTTTLQCSSVCCSAPLWRKGRLLLTTLQCSSVYCSAPICRKTASNYLLTWRLFCLLAAPICGKTASNYLSSLRLFSLLYITLLGKDCFETPFQCSSAYCSAPLWRMNDSKLLLNALLFTALHPSRGRLCLKVVHHCHTPWVRNICWTLCKAVTPIIQQPYGTKNTIYPLWRKE